MSRFKNKVALITGAASGIGKETAKSFAREGAKVVLIDINKENGQALEKEIGENALFLQADVSDADLAPEIFKQAVDHFGQIDILFNNAGYSPRLSFHEDDYAEHIKTIDITLIGTLIYSRLAISHFLERGIAGNIVNTASVNGLVGASHLAAYGAAKHGVIGLTKGLAVEYADQNIRVNAVAPGVIDTPMVTSPHEEMVANVPFKRLGEVEDIANAVLFLASDESKYITGTSLVVDGGYTAV